jgi:hypothetical protein
MKKISKTRKSISDDLKAAYLKDKKIQLALLFLFVLAVAVGKII